ncbi:MAG TPA: FecR family protein [Candidatus Paceibacterota bacterium]|nr:FecR family protein [Verrucomicrobiota bacterium]HSA09605.1 FecR family protein [Candidatus Paceibacterota bacterium]
MKETRNLLKRLAVCGLALAMVSTLSAQPVTQGVAKVVRLKGAARYKNGGSDWQQLKAGDVVKPGMLIQTADKSRCDIALGDGSPPVARPVANEALAYQPAVEQNLVRIWENTLLGIDKLTETKTGADVVSETQLDLRAGHIFGMVKKMSAASKYEVKIPNGVAGIRGTVYDISAEGIVKVLSGSVVLAHVAPDGTVTTQLIMGLQEFDAPKNVLKPLSDPDKSGMQRMMRQLPAGIIPPITPISNDKTIDYVSPH